VDCVDQEWERDRLPRERKAPERTSPTARWPLSPPSHLPPGCIAAGIEIDPQHDVSPLDTEGWSPALPCPALPSLPSLAETGALSHAAAEQDTNELQRDDRWADNGIQTLLTGHAQPPR
jgi:hypothetical protein